MKKILPYILITLIFLGFLFFKHRDIFSYKFNPNLISNYLRSQDIEDPLGKIKDRIFLSDSDIYIASGYLYAKGENPVTYNFQHPPLMKYLFGFSILLTGDPFYVQIIFGLVLLFLTYFLGKKVFKKTWVSLIGVLLLLIDPVFSGMMNEVLLDLGQAVFALAYVILVFFYPESFILQGVILGLFAASKFWSTAILFLALIFAYKLFIRKEKINVRKTILSFCIAFLVFALSYIKSFVDNGGFFNIIFFLAKDLRFMLAHDSSDYVGGPIFLFLSGFYNAWWRKGAIFSGSWSVFWPAGLLASLFLALKTKMNNIKSFFYLLPFSFLLLTSTETPFARYFIIILPYIYLNLSSLFFSFPKRYNRWSLRR